MADINLEKNEGGSMTWLWVLLAIVLLALIAWWLMRDRAVVEPVETTTSPTTITERAGPRAPVVPFPESARLDLPA